MSRVQIASVHFAPLIAVRPYAPAYEMPPLEELGKTPARLTIEDVIQTERGPYATSPFEGQRSFQEHTITAYEIADDLIGWWSRLGMGMTGDCHPGVWLVRDRVPEMEDDGKGGERYRLNARKQTMFRPATHEERMAMWKEDYAANVKADAKYGEYLIVKGDFIHGLPTDDPRRVPGISPPMRMACEFYGVRRRWTLEVTSHSTKHCTMCQEAVPGAAIVCPRCSWPLDMARYRHMMEEARKQLGGIEPPTPHIVTRSSDQTTQ